jgi:hypothetical protein
MLRGVIFQELCAIGGDIIQFIPFVRAIYAFEFPLFYNHHNCEDDVTIIPSTMGTYHGAPWGGALFVVGNFRALSSIASHFPFYLFLSIANDTHIIGPPSIVSFAYEHFQIELCVIGLSIQPLKCIGWSPFSLPPNFNTLIQFTNPSKGI